jgi:hypothetical protein
MGRGFGKDGDGRKYDQRKDEGLQSATSLHFYIPKLEVH